MFQLQSLLRLFSRMNVYTQTKVLMENICGIKLISSDTKKNLWGVKFQTAISYILPTNYNKHISGTISVYAQQLWLVLPARGQWGQGSCSTVAGSWPQCTTTLTTTDRMAVYTSAPRDEAIAVQQTLHFLYKLLTCTPTTVHCTVLYTSLHPHSFTTVVPLYSVHIIGPMICPFRWYY